MPESGNNNAITMSKPNERIVAVGSPTPQSVTFGIVACGIIVIVLTLFNSQLFHWFVIPVTLAGSICLADTIGWLRSRNALFDPAGIFAMFGLHFFFLAPLLHVYLDWSMPYVSAPTDWRPWLGLMAIFNLLGLFAYEVVRLRILGKPTRALRPWRLNIPRFKWIVLVSLILSASLQGAIYVQYGGLSGYITHFESEQESFEGLGFTFLFSEAFPRLAIIAFVVLAGRRRLRRSWVELLIIFIAFFALQLFFGGLRGSRSNTIWAIFYAAAAIHFWIRPIPKSVIPLGLIVLTAFMYVYGFYKSAGSQVISVLDGTQTIESLESQTGRGLPSTLLLDFGRSDVQAFLLYRLLEVNDYEYAFGRTYLGSMAMLVPKSVWPSRPPRKHKEGTDAQYGMGTYSQSWNSSRQYGLAGEILLNFGPLFIPLGFAFFGLFLGLLQRWIQRIPKHDVRLLIAPYLINLSILGVLSDSDNVVFFLVKNGAFPVLVLLCSATYSMKPGRPRATSGSVALAVPYRPWGR